MLKTNLDILYATIACYQPDVIYMFIPENFDYSEIKDRYIDDYSIVDMKARVGRNVAGTIARNKEENIGTIIFGDIEHYAELSRMLGGKFVYVFIFPNDKKKYIDLFEDRDSAIALRKRYYDIVVDHSDHHNIIWYDLIILIFFYLNVNIKCNTMLSWVR